MSADPLGPSDRSRRGVVGGLGALALAACGPKSHGEVVGPVNPAPLKSYAAFPVGCAVASSRLQDPAYAALVSRHFSQPSTEGASVSMI